MVLECLDNEFRASRNNIFNQKLEKLFAQTFHVKYAIALCNGTATLHCALAALGVGKNDEVIVPPLTMSSPALAVLQNGSVPVFADVDLRTFTVRPDSIEKCITPRTRAVISVALYGLAPDYDGILSVCRKHNLKLIEDNAQCFLGEYKGRMAGQFGHFASFSFQASKHMTCGDGGILITDNREFADKARRFGNLGYAGLSAKKARVTRSDIQDPEYERHDMLGFNYRLSDLSAAAAFGQTQRLKMLVEQRKKAARMFDKAARLYPEVLTRQDEPQGYRNSYWTWPAVLNTDNPKKDWHSFRTIFLKKGGDPYYAAWKLSYAEPLFQKQVQLMPGIWQIYKEGLCPNAEYLQPRLIQLKTNYWDIKEAVAQARILKDTIGEYVRKGGWKQWRPKVRKRRLPS